MKKIFPSSSLTMSSSLEHGTHSTDEPTEANKTIALLALQIFEGHKPFPF